jgi:hypothetical protein
VSGKGRLKRPPASFGQSSSGHLLGNPPPPAATAEPEPSIGQAILAGAQQYTDIRVPTLAIYAFPHDRGPEFLKDDPAARAAAEASELESLRVLIKAFEIGLPSLRTGGSIAARESLRVSIKRGGRAARDERLHRQLALTRPPSKRRSSLRWRRTRQWRSRQGSADCRRWRRRMNHPRHHLG